MKVKIKNFQSIKKLEMDIEGFTVITGRSNIGKSAIIRAIEGALTNKEGDSFVRDGTPYSEVSLSCPQIDLQWEKGKNKNNYVINGQRLDSVGRGSPPLVSDSGFRELEFNKTKLNAQIASQFSPIFLIDPSKISGSVAAEVISDVGRLHDVQSALRLCEKDKRNKESDVRVRERDLKSIEAELTSYDGLDQALSGMSLVKELRDLVRTLENELSFLESVLREYEDVKTVLETLKPLETVEIPVFDSEKVFTVISTLSTLWDTWTDTKAQVNNFKGVDFLEIPEPPCSSLVEDVAKLSSLKEHVDQASLLLERVGCDRIPDIPDTTVDASMLRDVEDLEKLHALFKDLTRTIPSYEASFLSCDKELNEAGTKIASLLKEAGQCPTCGKET